MSNLFSSTTVLSPEQVSARIALSTGLAAGTCWEMNIGGACLITSTALNRLSSIDRNKPSILKRITNSFYSTSTGGAEKLHVPDPK